MGRVLICSLLGLAAVTGCASLIHQFTVTGEELQRAETEAFSRERLAYPDVDMFFIGNQYARGICEQIEPDLAECRVLARPIGREDWRWMEVWLQGEGPLRALSFQRPTSEDD